MILIAQLNAPNIYRSFEYGWGLLWTNIDIFYDKVSEKTKIYLLKGGFLQLAI